MHCTEPSLVDIQSLCAKLDYRGFLSILSPFSIYIKVTESREFHWWQCQNWQILRVHGSCKGQTATQILNLGLQLNRTIFPVELCFWRCRTQKFLIIKYLLLFTRIFSHNSVTSWFKHSLVQYSKLPDVTLSNFEYAVAFQYSI